MNAKILVFVVCVETIIYLLLYNLRDRTFKRRKIPAAMKILSLMESKFNLFLEFFLRKYTFPWYLDKLIFLTFSFKSLIEAVSRRCYVKKRVLTNFEKFSGKRLCQSLFFNKVAGSACGKKSAAPAFYAVFLKLYENVNINKQKKNTFLQEHHCVKRSRIRGYSGPYSVRMRENTDQNNSEYGYISLWLLL